MKNRRHLAGQLEEAASFPNTQRDFETLVRDAITTGRGKLTFGQRDRLNLFYDERGIWLFVTPLAKDVAEKDMLIGSMVAAKLVEGCLHHVSFAEDAPSPFVGGGFGEPEILERPEGIGSGPASDRAVKYVWGGPWAWPLPASLRDEKTSREKAPRRVGRNEPCPCGSGKKTKHCCLPKWSN